MTGSIALRSEGGLPFIPSTPNHLINAVHDILWGIDSKPCADGMGHVPLQTTRHDRTAEGQLIGSILVEKAEDNLIFQL